MTLTTTNILDTYDGNGSTTSFPVTFQFFTSAELVVTERVKSTGVDTVLTEGVEYTVTGGLGAIGTVEAASPPSALVEWHIRRVTLTTQQVDFTPSTLFPSASAEEANDRAAMRDQEDRRDLARAMLIPTSDGALDMSLPSDTARGVTGSFLGFDGAGLPIIVTASVPAASVTPFMETVLDDATAAEAAATLEVVRNAGTVLAMRSGLLSGLGTAGAFPNQLYVSTDTAQAFYSDGSDQIDIGFRQATNATVGPAARDGRLFLDIDNLELLRDTGAALVPLEAPWPTGYRYGGKMTRSTVTTANQAITVTGWVGRTGTAGDRNLRNATLAAMEKDITDAGWTEGDQGNARPSAVGLAADTWYHVFSITKADGTTDMGIDTSITAANLLGGGEAGGESPPYIYHTRIGSVKTEAATTVLEDWVQEGDLFRHKTKTLDVNVTTTSFDPRVTQALTTPPDVRVLAEVHAIGDNAADGFLLQALDDVAVTLDDTLPITVGQLPPQFGIAGTATEARPLQVMTDTSSQIAIKGNGSCDLALYVVGWRDFISED